MIIKEGRHRPALSFPRLVLRRSIVRVVTFHPSCRYDIGSDQGDWNKLIGVGFFPHHHKNSYRIAWRYNDNSDKIELAAYWYHKGIRYTARLWDVNIDQPVRVGIEWKDGEVVLSANKEYLVIDGAKWPWIGYRLGLYFGGNQPAPHDIEITIK